MHLSSCRYALLAVVCCAVLTTVLPVSAAPACSEAPQLDFEQELAWANSCTVQLDCDAVPGHPAFTISCTSSGGNCSTQGDCVVCDGVQQSCCDEVGDCLSQCHGQYLVCFSNCPPPLGSPCHQACRNARDLCQNNCF